MPVADRFNRREPMKDDSHDLSERVALFRHRLIAQLLPEDLTARQRQRTIERIVAADHQIRIRRLDYRRDSLKDIFLRAMEMNRGGL